MALVRVLSITLALSAVERTQALWQRDMPSEVDVTIATTVYTTICPVSTYVAPGGQTVISSGSAVIIDETNTIVVPTVTSETVITTNGVTITFSPQASDPITTVINGQTVVSSSRDVIIGGTDTVELPPVSSQSQLATDGITFTLLPQAVDPVTTVINGQTVVSSSRGVVIGGTDTVELPPVSTQSELFTDGITFTLSPQTAQTVNTVTTIINGQTILSSAGGAIIDGTDTVEFPPVSSPSELVTNGITFTLTPTTTNVPSSTGGPTDQPTGGSDQIRSTTTTLNAVTGGITAITTEITTGSDGEPTSLTQFSTLSSIPAGDSGASSLPITGVTTGTDGLPTPFSIPGYSKLTTITTVTTGEDGLTTPNIFTTVITVPTATDTMLATMTTVITGADGLPTPNLITTVIVAPTPTDILMTMTTVATGADGLTIPTVLVTTLVTAPTTTVDSTPTDYPHISIPGYSIPPGAEETSRALDAVPLLFWLYDNVDLIEDDRYKIWFIDRIKESRDNIVGLFNSFTDKPDPKPECSKTSMKRSLISAIADALKTAVDLISCATQVMDNLVKATTDLTNLPMAEIGLLTDTLHDIGNEMEKKKNDPTDTATQASETGTSTASSTSSCTTSLTVTWESVFCTVTTTLDVEQTPGETSMVEVYRRDDGCSTTAYSVVTDCTATASTATSTTTATETPTGTLLAGCDVDSCGETSDSCAAQERGILYRRSTPRKTEPATCKWAEKSNYENPADFMANEVKLAVDSSNVVPINALFTAKLVSFQDKPVSVAVNGLYGCTSIIAVSRRGVWASHVYEIPVFRPKSKAVPIMDKDGKPRVDPATGAKLERPVYARPGRHAQITWQTTLAANEQLQYFSDNCLTPMRVSSGTGDTYGLSECRNAAQAESGYWEGHVFDDDSDTKIFIVAPLERVPDTNDPNFGAERPTGLQLMWDSADTTHKWGFVRADWGRGSGKSYNAQIRDQITSIFDGISVPISTIPYAPMEGSSRDQLRDTGFNSNRGKILIQYQPAVTSEENSKASWRVWFEGHDDTVQTSSWDPLPARGDPSRGGAAEQKCVDVCERTARDDSNACSPDSGSPSAADSSTIQAASSSGGSTTTAAAAPTPTGCTADADCQNGAMAGSCPPAQPPVCQDSKCMCRPDTPPTHTEQTTALAAATPMTTETANITPLGQKSSLHCWDESTFPGHGDVDGPVENYWADDFCTENRNRLEVLYSDFSKDHVYSARESDVHGINYDFKVEWASNCQTTQDSQSIQYPSDPNGASNGDSCTSLLRGVYSGCNNGGVGGEIQVGCLIYSFVGAKG